MSGASPNRAPPRPSLDDLVRAHLAAARGTPVRVGGRAVNVFAWSEISIAPWRGTIARLARERGPAPRVGTAQPGAMP
jgi:hypothetical protein